MKRRQLLLTGAALGGSFVTGWLAKSASKTLQAEQSAEPAPPEVTGKQEILMLVYPRFTTLDLIGPQHVFSMLGPEYKTFLVWKDNKEVISDTGVPLRPTRTFKECRESPAILFVPGGTDGTLAAMQDPEVREFLASRGATARFVTSVCTGSLVLGAAGLLQGFKATTHWLALDSLRNFGAEPVAERVVVDRNRVTGAGVTAGIDFALTLAAKIKDDKYAKAIQLMMEYDPQAPFPKDGNPKTAEPENVTLLKAMADPFTKQLNEVVKQLNLSKR